MTKQLERVEQIADETARKTATKFAPDVIRIRYSIGQNWVGDPAIFFRILLSDEASREDTLASVTRPISNELFDDFQLLGSDFYPYFSFRSKSEQDRLKDPDWD